MFANIHVLENAVDKYDGYYHSNVVIFTSDDTALIARLTEAMKTFSVPELNALSPELVSHGEDWLYGELWVPDIRRGVSLRCNQTPAGAEIELSSAVRTEPLDGTSYINSDELFWLDFVKPMRALMAVMGQGRAH